MPKRCLRKFLSGGHSLGVAGLSLVVSFSIILPLY